LDDVGQLAEPPAACHIPRLTRQYRQIHDRVADVFLGRSTEFKPVDLPESSVARETFYKKATGRDAAQVRAVWARLIFIGRGKLPKELPDAAAVKKAVAADPNVVGYIDKADLDPSVKVVLSLN
jgi:hypothetical protein